MRALHGFHDGIKVLFRLGGFLQLVRAAPFGGAYTKGPTVWRLCCAP